MPATVACCDAVSVLAYFPDGDRRLSPLPITEKEKQLDSPQDAACREALNIAIVGRRWPAKAAK